MAGVPLRAPSKIALFRRKSNLARPLQSMGHLQRQVHLEEKT
jgi:hypothetical protein